MPDTPFIITVDTEGDNLWSRPHTITTHNAEHLPRFQALCEKYRLKPVYLVNYEMALSAPLVEFGRDVEARACGEIGMHLHAWNSPPIVPLTHDDYAFQPYLIDYPDAVMKAKIHTLTALLEERFGHKITSHRAGRWALDGRYLALLREEGYRVDCSVTPGVDWRPHRGAPEGRGGSDYSRAPKQAYYVDPADLSRPATHGLLEVPVTVHASGLYRRLPTAYRVPLVRRYANRVSPGLHSMCPGLSSAAGMLHAARLARNRGAGHVELALHSSELMPGGSPMFQSMSDVERLYDQLEHLFDYLSTWCRGMTLREFGAAMPLGGSPS